METSMLNALFASRVRVRLLTLFLLNPEARFYARALAQRIGAQYSAVWKELKRLEQAGVLLSESSPTSKSYYINPRLAILPELRSIILKTVGAGDILRRGLEGSSGQIQAAFVYGSFAAGDADPQSDLDVMLIGEVDLARLAPLIARLEKSLGRAVNYTVYSPAEWRAKQRQRDPFIENVLTSPKVILIGDEDALRTTRATRTHQALQGASRRNPKTAQTRGARSRHRRA
jgi:predicted nucleotidyltransferase